MDIENIVKADLLSLFNKGKSETEAYDEISKTQSPHEVSKKIVNKWFKIFRSENNSLSDKFSTDSKEKLTDEQIINLINMNPDLCVEKISKLAKCSFTTIWYRINKLKNNGENVNYLKKDASKFSDEHLIDLVDKNPDLNMKELAKLVGTSASTISRRIKKIKSTGERINYTCKSSTRNRSEISAGNNPNLKDEYIINLINENPNYSIEKLAVLAETSPSNMWKRIKQINNKGEIVYHNKDNKKLTDESLTNLINKNPELSMEKLSTLANTSICTIRNRIANINSNEERVSYVNKGIGRKSKIILTDEALINYINENPDLNMAELAKLIGISRSTISRRIKKINSDGERVQYIKKVNVRAKS
jgi:DNA-binding Lrp family transcriptional regulator